MQNENGNTEFDLQVENKQYHVTPNYEVDLVLYKVYEQDRYLFTIGLNGDAQWELCDINDELRNANNYEKLIEEIGEAIEQKTF